MKKSILLPITLLALSLNVVSCGDSPREEREEAREEINEGETEIDRDVLGDDEVELND